MNADAFVEFYRQVDGHEPFPWQTRLAAQVVRDGEWPELIALPTSAGKTATIDIAVFALAVAASRKDEQRRAPLRTFFVVDRRVVVDEAFDRANRIAGKLRRALTRPTNPLHEIAVLLASFGRDKPLEDPLHAALLRGGMYREDAWARSPAQPTVCVSTVDQVGSRILFRGYGLSEAQRPLQAGLMGCDSLIIVDEAHISQPFVETLLAVQRYAGDKWAQELPMRPLRVVQMTATPRPGNEPFQLQADDQEHPVLNQRLTAHKLARLVDVPAEKDNEAKNRQEFATQVVKEALKLADTGNTTEPDSSNKRRRKMGTEPATVTTPPASVIGIVVNRVATARQVFEMLDRHQTGGEKTGHCILLTGRVRPYDRDELLHREDVSGKKGWLRFIGAKREDTDTLEKPLFVIATQTIEVGADLSFDALVTEAAPLDALRQRFGRLDRLGKRRDLSAVIIGRKDAVAKNADDPIYGKAASNTWTRLTGLAGKAKVIDFGVNSLQPFVTALGDKELQELCSPSMSKHAPVMLPAHVDTLCQTSPEPEPDPDLALFLHGPQSGPADVQIVWRADLWHEGMSSQDVMKKQGTLVDTVALVPPTSMEALPVPIFQARRWLLGQDAGYSLADLEGAGVEEADSDGRRAAIPDGQSLRLALCWRGPEASRLITARDLHPGDTIIVPTWYGGTDKFGWKPDSVEDATDVGDACARLARWRPMLRLHPGLLASWNPALGEAVRKMLQPDDENDANTPPFREILNAIRDCVDIPGWLANTASDLLTKQYRKPVVAYPDDSGWRLQCSQRLTREEIYAPDADIEEPEDAPPADDTASFVNLPAPREAGPGEKRSARPRAMAPQAITLKEHLKGVAAWARRLSDAVGLPGCLPAVLEHAGALHDLGKADTRFQTMLYGYEVAPETDELLAKSGMERAKYHSAWLQSGLPTGFRHEFVSVPLLRTHGIQLLGNLPNDLHELVAYLIGTHHGRGRPFVPVVEEPSNPAVEVKLTWQGCSLSVFSNHKLWQLGGDGTGINWTDLFWQLVRRFGYWGLAYLEAVLVLADHRRSREEEEKP